MPIALAVFLAQFTPAARAAPPLQSALDARGENAGQILEITWVLFVGGALIFTAVMAIAAVALLGTGRLRDALARRGWIVGAGIVFPVVVLTALLIYTFAAAAAMTRAERTPAAVRIQVEGELWWWRVRYLDAAGATVLETANEIHIPAGQPVDLDLVSDNVIHSFWVPNLAGKLDMIPGRTNRLRIQAREPGVFRGQCAEYCGAQHARMALFVVALAPGDFSGWLQARRAPAPAPTSVDLVRGRALFLESRCGVCHSIRGTAAAGTLGPDLTHVGARLSLAAATLPNGTAALAGWIAGTQHVKPEAQMPAYASFSAEELQALAGYLESLR